MQKARDFYSFISSKEVQSRSRGQSDGGNTMIGTREPSIKNESIR